MNDNGKFFVGLCIVVCVIIGIILIAMSATTIPTKHVGVTHILGNVYGEPLEPGFHMINQLQV